MDCYVSNFPKGSDLDHWTSEQLHQVAAELNDRPRKTLGDHTPHQLMRRSHRSSTRSAAYPPTTRGRNSRGPKAHFLKLRHESEIGPVATHCNKANTGGGMRHVSSKHPLPALHLTRAVIAGAYGVSVRSRCAKRCDMAGMAPP
jgi:hypothetical protein